MEKQKSRTAIGGKRRKIIERNKEEADDVVH